jgi:XTP/dITP diphosphohydrolase
VNEPVPARRLLLATHNAGKLAELRAKLADLPLQLVSLRALAIDAAVEETGATFRENAELKARAYAQASGLWTLAEDSGLEVDALGGEPGVHSARYLGPEATDPQRIVSILERLRGVPPEQRTARFLSAIALARPTGEVEVVEDAIEGRIAGAPRGAHGFGYDPIFLVPSLGQTTAELTPEAKNAISHRGLAAEKAKEILQTWLADEGAGELTHFDASGRARMVDVSAKPDTERLAIARGEVHLRPETLSLVRAGRLAKGDVLAVAQVAGMMAAKNTPQIIPMCHVLLLSGVSLDFRLDDVHSTIDITATVKTIGKTGAEMEALTAVSAAALTIYDMCKAVDRGMHIENVRLIRKQGGKSGEFTQE